MTIEEMAAWGELVGGVASAVAAVAVIASLIFVGMQIRSNTKSMRLAARQALLDTLQRNALVTADNGESADICVAASRKEKLTPPQKFRLFQFLRGYVNSVCTYAVFRKHNFISKEELEAQLAVLRKTTAQAYFPEFWERFSDEFDPDFALMVDRMLAPPDG